MYVLPFPLTRPFLDAGLATFPDEFDYPPLRILPSKVLDRITNAWLKNTKIWIKPFQRVAKQYGIAPIERLIDIYEGDFNLVTDIPELTGVKNLPPNWQYIAPIKTHIQNQNIEIPKNVWVYDWLPAPKVNPLADIAVIHGGQGTVQTACAAGTPFVGIGLQPEQESNIDALVKP